MSNEQLAALIGQLLKKLEDTSNALLALDVKP